MCHVRIFTLIINQDEIILKNAERQRLFLIKERLTSENIWVKKCIDEKIDGSSGTFCTHRAGGGNANKARGINLHSYTKNDCRARCRSLLLFGKSIKELSPYCRQIIDIQYFECRKFSFTMNRYSSWALGRRSLRLPLSPFHLKLLNYSPLILPELCTAEAPLAVLILVRKDQSTLYDVFTHVWIINFSRDIRPESWFNSKILCPRNATFTVVLSTTEAW